MICKPTTLGDQQGNEDNHKYYYTDAEYHRANSHIEERGDVLTSGNRHPQGCRKGFRSGCRDMLNWYPSCYKKPVPWPLSV